MPMNQNAFILEMSKIMTKNMHNPNIHFSHLDKIL